MATGRKGRKHNDVFVLGEESLADESIEVGELDPPTALNVGSIAEANYRRSGRRVARSSDDLGL